MARLLVCAWVMAAANAPAYRGEVTLPMDLYTPSGTHLEARKYQIEIRQEGSRYQLAFVDKDKAVDTVPGRSPNAENVFTVPITGVVVLWPPEPAEKPEPKSKLSPYLTNISWQAVLRVYRSHQSSDREVHALLRAKGQTIEFPLYLEKPSTSGTTK
jgi:hypothetical protein